MPVTLIVATSIVAALPAIPTIPQQPTLIPDKPTCQGCEIVLGPTRVALGDDLSSDLQLSGFLALVRGSTYVAAARSGAPQAFDRQGRYLRSLGRTGSGPTEFRSSSAFALGPDDSLAVFDGGNARINIFDGDLRFARSIRAPQSIINGGMVWLPGSGGFVLSGIRVDQAQAGYTVHLYASDGSHRRSIAEAPAQPNSPTSSGFQAFRLLQATSNDELVSVPIALDGSYRIDVWHLPSGQLRHSWRREKKEFAAVTGPFPPRVVSTRVDSTGLLWTVVVVRAEDWERGAKVRAIGEGPNREVGYQIVDRNLISDVIIEVVDFRRGKLLASARLDQAILGQLADGSLVAESGGGGTLDVLPVALRRP